jgi:hypothetical protein
MTETAAQLQAKVLAAVTLARESNDPDDLVAVMFECFQAALEGTLAALKELDARITALERNATP